jgi:hypothetical protein
MEADMPSYSGLYDGVFGVPYTPITNPRPPLTGILRVLLQKRGLYGVARGLGLHTPATVKAVDMDRNDMIVRGGWTYATRIDDAANRVTITNIGGDVNTLADQATPATVSDSTSKKRIGDTHLNRSYIKDGSNVGVTATTLAERYQP